MVTAWLDKAEEDLLACVALLNTSLPSYDLVGFHAQQAGEKALKALLIRHQVRFGKTHDLEELLRLVEPIAPGVSQQLAEADALTPYAVDSRYPGAAPPLTREEAGRAHAVAAHVLHDVRNLLRPYLDAGRPEG